jgi:glycosyltransferase involved in cell wall biosynthesis
MANVFLSICIPTYNRSAYLKRCIDSILCSNNDKIEVIISNNASLDDTDEVVKSFNDSRIRYQCLKENIGGDRNTISTLQLAKGEWVFILTDDDYLLPGALEKIINILEENSDIGVMISGFKRFTCEETILNNKKSLGVEIFYDYLDYYDKTKKFDVGIDSIEHLHWGLHYLSRITIRREYLNFDGIEDHIASMYPVSLLTGRILLNHPGLYVHDYFVARTVDNVTFWQLKDDIMIGGRIKIIKEIFQGDEYKNERNIMFNQLVDQIVKDIMPFTWSIYSPSRFLYCQMKIFKNREVYLSSHYWFNLSKFLTKAVYMKITTGSARHI